MAVIIALVGILQKRGVLVQKVSDKEEIYYWNCHSPLQHDRQYHTNWNTEEREKWSYC